MRWMSVLLATLALALLALPAAAQDAEPVTDDEVNAIASRLYCPVCENVPLDVCGTQACADWRAEIRTMLEEGATEAEIRASFAERYGRRVLATPDSTSFDRYLWVLPVVGVVLGGVVLALGLNRIAPDALIAAPQAAAHPKYDDLDPEYLARVEADLKEFTL